MAETRKLIELSRSGVTIGTAGLGLHGHAPSSVKQAVHDGDTITSRALANVSIRFLGIDTPEVSFTLPGSRAFTSIARPEWAAFLADPFAGWPEADAVLGAPLVAHLQPRLGADTAANHARHAETAHRTLEDLVQADLDAFAGGDREAFAFFLRYAHDAIDRYGRLLAYVNVNLPPAGPRPDTYNERMLQAGLASPYFIWPNLDPFKRQPHLLAAVLTPQQTTAAAAAGKLGDARQWVREARAAGRGIFGADPLALDAFELRLLAGRRAPSRWVVDLSGGHPGLLLRPARYFEVPNVEDRLYVPDEFVPLFETRGWQRQA